MPSSPIAAIMVHVADVNTALAWYEQAFPVSQRARAGADGVEFLTIEGIQLEFVPADEKVKSGACGSVIYWHIPSFESALVRLQSMGAKLHRGPMLIEDGLYMCQVQDLWGNCIGLRGPSSKPNATL
jgi:uncharacterized protein